MSLQLTAGRMAAFSDDVIAVIITIMVLELACPHRIFQTWRPCTGSFRCW